MTSSATSSGQTTAPAPSAAAPGLSLPQDFPPLAAPSGPPLVPPKMQRKVTSSAAIKPVVPVLPQSSARGSTTVKESQSTESNTLPEQSPTKADRKKEASIADDKPANNADMEMKVDAGTDIQPQPAPGLEVEASTKKSRSTDKKQRPEKLDIAAAKAETKPRSKVGTISGVTKPTTKGKPEGSDAIEPSEPPTPATAVSQMSATSAVRQNQSRSVKIPPPTKAEASSPGFATSSKLPSRRASLTSNRPGTPVDEKMSDIISMTSTSISRANSPPPSRVGTAPVRQVTKSQQKKERQARAKQAEVLTKPEEITAKVEEVQAPIIGRKKKTKKDRTQGTADSTPTVTRPTSPVSKEEVADDKVSPAATTPDKDIKKGQVKVMAETNQPETPPGPTTPATGEDKKTSPSAASIISSLLRDSEISQSTLDLFKAPVPSLNGRFENIELDYADLEFATEDQLHLLEQGEAIDIERGPNHHIIMLPDRRAVPGLTADQAARYLELRKSTLARGDTPVQFSLDYPDANTLFLPPLSTSDPESRALLNKFSDPMPQSGRFNEHNFKTSDGVVVGAKGYKPQQSVAELEHSLAVSRKEVEGLEKRLNAVMKKNKRILMGGMD